MGKSLWFPVNFPLNQSNQFYIIFSDFWNNELVFWFLLYVSLSTQVWEALPTFWIELMWHSTDFFKTQLAPNRNRGVWSNPEAFGTWCNCGTRNWLINCSAFHAPHDGDFWCIAMSGFIPVDVPITSNILWMEEILHQLVYGLTHCNPIIYSVL